MNFNKLVYAHYVERCPKPEPFFDPLIDEQSTSTRKRAPKVSNVYSLLTIMGINLHL
jgi:DNA-directed RNA polymerase III subunit RPC3